MRVTDSVDFAKWMVPGRMGKSMDGAMGQQDWPGCTLP